MSLIPSFANAALFATAKDRMIEIIEGVRLSPYNDSKNLVTVGIGRLLEGSEFSNRWNEYFNNAGIDVELRPSLIFESEQAAGEFSQSLQNRLGYVSLQVVRNWFEEDSKIEYWPELKRNLSQIVVTGKTETLKDIFIQENGLNNNPALQQDDVYSREVSALFYLFYNSGGTNPLFGPNIRMALSNIDRARSWFQIRYNGQISLQATDYAYMALSELFGLLENSVLSQQVYLASAVNALSMLSEYADWIHIFDSRELSGRTPAGRANEEIFSNVDIRQALPEGARTSSELASNIIGTLVAGLVFDSMMPENLGGHMPNIPTSFREFWFDHPAHNQVGDNSQARSYTVFDANATQVNRLEAYRNLSSGAAAPGGATDAGFVFSGGGGAYNADGGILAFGDSGDDYINATPNSDFLIGSEGNDTFFPWAGDDIVHGGGVGSITRELPELSSDDDGYDTVNYAVLVPQGDSEYIFSLPSKQTIEVKFLNGNGDKLVIDPWSNSDALISIEHIIGKTFSDGQSNIIMPMHNGSIDRSGSGYRYRENGVDNILDGTWTIYGDAYGLIRLFASSISDVVFLGSGHDVLSFDRFHPDITNLQLSINTLDPGSARVAGVEYLWGSAYNDVINASDVALSFVNGLDGDDIITGADRQLSPQTIMGGNGNDIIYAGVGGNVFGGLGNDVIYLTFDTSVGDYSASDRYIFKNYGTELLGEITKVGEDFIDKNGYTYIFSPDMISIDVDGDSNIDIRIGSNRNPFES